MAEYVRPGRKRKCYALDYSPRPGKPDGDEDWTCNQDICSTKRKKQKTSNSDSDSSGFFVCCLFF